MLRKKEKCKITLFFLSIIFITIIQYLIAEYLQKLSIPLIKFLQKDSYLIKSMEIVSFIGSKNIKFILMITIFSLCNLYHSFLFAFTSYFSMFVCAWLKFIWQQERPYWVNDQIIPYECESGFGYPSNHVLTTVVSFMVLFEILYEHFKIEEKYINSKFFYWIGITLTYLLCVSIGFSRIVLGVHSIDQVVFALLMGLACYYFFIYLTELRTDNLKYFLHLVSNRYQIAKFLVFVIAIYLLFLINIYFTPTEYNPDYVGRVLIMCPGSTPFAKSVMASGQFFIILGMMFGIVYDVHNNYFKKFNNNELSFHYLDDNFYRYDLSLSIEGNHTHSAYVEDSNYHFYLKTVAKIIILYFMTDVFKFVFSCGICLFDPSLISKFIFLEVLYNTSVGIFIFGFGRNFMEIFKLNGKNKLSQDSKGVLTDLS